MIVTQGVTDAMAVRMTGAIEWDRRSVAVAFRPDPCLTHYPLGPTLRA